MKGRKPENGICAKHKLKFNNEEMDKFFGNLTRSIRTKKLQCLVLLAFNIFDPRLDLNKRIMQRIDEEERRLGRHLNRDKHDMLSFLKIEDIQEMLKCSKRTAYEYKRALELLSMFL